MKNETNLLNILSALYTTFEGCDMICIRDEESDWYIGRLDGGSSSLEYRALITMPDVELLQVNFNKTAISGNQKVDVKFEIVLKNLTTVQKVYFNAKALKNTYED